MMGRKDGFLLYERIEDPERIPALRILDYNEIHEALRPSERKKQAARCMNCGVPFCQTGMILNGMVTGCPLHNLIPEWNDDIYRGNEAHALHRLLKMNPFPEFTGRVCPALCEKACINGFFGSPVAIRDNERYLIERGYEENNMRAVIPQVRSDKRVAVVGSGPAGLSAAYRLNRRGHHVEVYERDDEIGGLLMYGIPNMKLDKDVIRRRRRMLEEEGIIFRCNVNVGTDITVAQLKEQYDAVILACGAKQERMPDIEGIRDTKGVVKAVEFLKNTTKALSSLPEVNAEGKNVIILGGGDTGNDCAASCIRQKCASVVQIEMMPEPPAERAENNPWPEWPKVLKTDYGQIESIHVFKKDPRLFSTTITALISQNGEIREAETAGIRFEKGKPVISDERKILPCDLLIIAAGFTGCETELPLSAGIECTKRNTVLTQPGKYMTSVNGIFTAGDMHRGQSLVVHAINEGLQCAKEADEWMMGYTNLI